MAVLERENQSTVANGTAGRPLKINPETKRFLLRVVNAAIVMAIMYAIILAGSAYQDAHQPPQINNVSAVLY